VDDADSEYAGPLASEAAKSAPGRGPIEEGTDILADELGKAIVLTESETELVVHAESSLAFSAAHNRKPYRITRASWLETPDGLETDVAFWHDIYSKYDRNEVVLHHPRHLGIVYAVVTLSDIEADLRLTAAERSRIRDNRVNAKRNEYTGILKKLASGAPERSLTREEIRIKRMFDSIDDEPNKFRRALEDGIRSQTGQRDKFVAGLKHSGRYLGEIEKIFDAYAMPREITRLIFVESMFNLKAVSKTGASGIWQFMPGTGKLYLRMNDIVDERNDPIASTHAAAKLLRRNYDSLGTWPLAINAYNAGRGRLEQAVARTGTTEIARIIKEFSHPGYGFASRNFFPEFLAALDVAENAEKYFGRMEHDPPLRYEVLRTSLTILIPEVAQLAGLKLEEVLELNPALGQGVASGADPLPAGFALRVPEGRGRSFLAAAARAPSSSSRPLKHLVRRGETLQEIARTYGVEPRAIVEANDGMGWRVRIGQTILVPVGRRR